MIKFYRRLRFELMENNKTGKYLKYAIGEIVLVVIGILIALQVNNWNQKRLEDIERQKIIESLNLEFKQSKKEFTVVKENHLNSKNASLELMGFIGTNTQQKLNQKVIDSLIDKIFPISDYIPSNNALDDIIQSGKLSSLDNSKLSSKLSEWKSILHILSSRDDKLEEWIFSQLIPYLNKYVSWRDVGVQNNYNWSTKGALPSNYNYIFTDLEFENILENHIFFVNESLRRQTEALTIINEIIELTSDNINP
ncbi:DUF6090 family protein [Aegicerativicinus sediminis]|uniref:DUF6090 family protein n=1 Tax=Aegicerativicinus sediminis TaxID=2893202 RepID=UPI001E4D5C0A|nr:DUF6090 family protein [Aegicerativicinus sediminis]